MKKFLAMLLALVMALSLVACGDKPDANGGNGDGDFKRLFILSIGLRSCCNENSSFRISNLLSSAFSAQRYCSMTS